MLNEYIFLTLKFNLIDYEIEIMFTKRRNCWTNNRIAYVRRRNIQERIHTTNCPKLKDFHYIILWINADLRWLLIFLIFTSKVITYKGENSLKIFVRSDLSFFEKLESLNIRRKIIKLWSYSFQGPAQMSLRNPLNYIYLTILTIL